MSINQIVGSPINIGVGLIIFSFVTTIIFIVVGNVKAQKQNKIIKKQKKTLASTIIYDNELLSLRGEAQRDPQKDNTGAKYGKAHFCNKISLTIKNEGNMPVDTDPSEQPIAFKLDVRGKLESFGIVPGVELLDVKPANPKLDLSTRDGEVLLDHVHLDPGESLQLVFTGYFIVDLWIS